MDDKYNMESFKSVTEFIATFVTMYIVNQGIKKKKKD